MSNEAGSPQYLGDFDETMDRCGALAAKLYQAEHVLSHEGVADGLARFLWARLDEMPDTPDRTALLSVVNARYRTATYLSCGQKLIVASLAELLRLAMAYTDRPGYRGEWAP